MCVVRGRTNALKDLDSRLNSDGNDELTHERLRNFANRSANSMFVNVRVHLRRGKLTQNCHQPHYELTICPSQTCIQAHTSVSAITKIQMGRQGLKAMPNKIRPREGESDGVGRRKVQEAAIPSKNRSDKKAQGVGRF